MAEVMASAQEAAQNAVTNENEARARSAATAGTNADNKNNNDREFFMHI